MTHLLWWPEATLAAVTAVYLAGIGFRLLMICVGSTTATPRFGEVPATPGRAQGARLPTYTVLAPLTSPGATAAETAKLIADLAALDYPGHQASRCCCSSPQTARRPAWTAARPLHRGQRGLRGPAPGLRRRPGQGKRQAMRWLPSRAAARRPASCAPQRPPSGSCLTGSSPFRRRCAARTRTSTGCPSASRPSGRSTRCWCCAGSTSSGSCCPSGARPRTSGPTPSASSGRGRRANHGDADLGERIARRGWDVRLLASVTTEEADSRVDGWLGTAPRRSGTVTATGTRGPLVVPAVAQLGPARFAASSSRRRSVSAPRSRTRCSGCSRWPGWSAVPAGRSPGCSRCRSCSGGRGDAAGERAQRLFADDRLYGAGHVPSGQDHVLAPVYWALTSIAAYRALLPPQA